MSDFDSTSLTRRIRRARSTFERERQRLYRHDGKPAWGPEEHKERLAALQNDLDDEVSYVQEQMQAELASIAQAELVIGRDPIYTLDAETLTRANAVSHFIAADLDHMDADSLLTSVDAAVAAVDRAALIVYQRLASQRVAASRQRTVVPGDSAAGRRQGFNCTKQSLRRLDAPLKIPRTNASTRSWNSGASSLPSCARRSS